MKIFKFIAVVLTIVAMSSTFVSCNRDNDITGNPFADHGQEVDGKQDYWISFELNSTSLSSEAIAFYNATLAEQIYPDDYAAGAREIKFIEHPMYVTEEYARNNFNKVKNIPAAENDFVQKVMVPVAQFAKTKDFDVVMTLSKDNMTTVLDSYTFRGQEVLAGVSFNE